MTRYSRLLVQRSLLPISDQALVSSTNFVTSLLLARAADSRELGIYVLIFSGMLFLQSVQTSILLMPMSTLGASLDNYQSSRYFGALWKCQILIGLISCVVAFLLSNIFLNQNEMQLRPILCVIAFSWQGQEFLRRLLFTRLRLGAAFFNDCVGHGGQLIAIVVLFMYNRLTLTTAIAVMGMFSTMALLMGLIQCRYLLDLRSAMKLPVRKNIQLGKWLLGSNLLTWTSSYAFNYMAAIMVGPVGPAVIQACGNIIGPINVVLNGMENVMPPLAAKKLSHQGATGLARFVRGLNWFLGGSLVFYTVTVGFFSKDILNVLYKGKYNDYSHLVWILGCSYVLSAFMRTSAIGLRSILKTKGIFYAYAVSSAFTLIGGIPLVKHYGIGGAVMGSLLTSGISASIVFQCYKSEMATLRDMC